MAPALSYLPDWVTIDGMALFISLLCMAVTMLSVAGWRAARRPRVLRLEKSRLPGPAVRSFDAQWEIDNRETMRVSYTDETMRG